VFRICKIPFANSFIPGIQEMGAFKKVSIRCRRSALDLKLISYKVGQRMRGFLPSAREYEVSL
jgi:hypothetical protein